MTEIESKQAEETERTVIGTLLAGVLSEREATEVAVAVKEAGGLKLFNIEIYSELWRRVDAALADRKHPWAYATIEQVEPVPVVEVLKIMESNVSGILIEEVYLPELIERANERRIRDACREVAEGGSITKGIEALKTVGPSTKPQTKEQVANEIIDEWEEAAKHPGKITGIDTGLADLNRMTWGWQPQSLVIIGARPSKGKTALLLGFARAAAIEHDVPTLFVTLESSVKELTKRLICQISRANQTDLRGGLAEEKETKGLPSAVALVNRKPIYFIDSSGKTIGAIQSSIRQFVSQLGIKLVIVDYLQKIRPIERNEKKTYEVAQASEGLKIIAKELNIPVISAAQVNREPEKKAGRAPALSDLADSGQIERDADVVGLINVTTPKEGRPEYSLIMAKMRDGPIGFVPLHFTPECARFDNASKIDERDIPPQSRNPHND